MNGQDNAIQQHTDSHINAVCFVWWKIMLRLRLSSPIIYLTQVHCGNYNDFASQQYTK